MNQEHFTNPELSKKLEELGVKSEFDYLWIFDDGDEKNAELVQEYSLGNDVSDNEVRAFHFSDILLPENAKKIWGQDIRDSIQPVVQLTQFIIQSVDDWQQWLEDEINKLVNG